MDFISERFVKSRVEDGGLPIMFTIRGETDIPESELTHLDGYKGSKPVRPTKPAGKKPAKSE